MIQDFISTFFSLILAGFSVWALYEIFMFFAAIFSRLKETETGDKMISYFTDRLGGWFGDVFASSSSKKYSPSQRISSLDKNKERDLIRIVRLLYNDNKRLEKGVLEIHSVKDRDAFIMYLYNQKHIENIIRISRFLVEQAKVLGIIAESKFTDHVESTVAKLVNRCQQLKTYMHNFSAEIRFVDEALRKANDKNKIKNSAEALAVSKKLDSSGQKYIDNAFDRFQKFQSDIVLYIQFSRQAQDAILEYIKHQREVDVNLLTEFSSSDEDRRKEWEEKQKKEAKAKEFKDFLKNMRQTFTSINYYFQRAYSLMGKKGAYSDLQKLDSKSIDYFVTAFKKLQEDYDAYCREMIDGNPMPLKGGGVHTPKVPRGDPQNIHEWLGAIAGAIRELSTNIETAEKEKLDWQATIGNDGKVKDEFETKENITLTEDMKTFLKDLKSFLETNKQNVELINSQKEQVFINKLKKDELLFFIKDNKLWNQIIQNITRRIDSGTVNETINAIDAVLRQK